MYKLVYIFSLLPSYAIPTNFGSVPIRYFTLIYLLFIGLIKKELMLFILLILLHISYMIFGSTVGRSIHLIDISYILSYLFVFQFCYISRRYPLQTVNFINVFFYLNIIYAVIQNIALNLGVVSDVLMLHQNTHVDHYVIPESYIPFFFRVTGLFVESVPFVTYLMTTLVYFEFRKDLLRRNICLAFIFLSGAKIGLVFIIFYYLLCFVKNDIAIYKWFVVLLFPIIGFFPVIDFYLNSFQNNEMMYSVYYRYKALINTFNDFSFDVNTLLFGKGFISSYELMTRDDIEFVRGNDFFSMFIYSNGIVGSLILLFPLLIFIVYLARPLPVKIINLFFVVFLLCLISIGTFTVFNYAYLAGVAYLLSWGRNEALNHHGCL